MDRFVVDDLAYEIRWSDRRRTVEIAIERDGALIMRAPRGVAVGWLMALAGRHEAWVRRKLAERRPPAPPRAFAPGERFPYLGRQHTLALVDQQDAPLKLVRGRFHLRDTAKRPRDAFVAWYRARGAAWLAPRIAAFAARMDVAPTAVWVRALGNRWGSCGENGVVNFHWRTIALPPPAIDYVVVHELAHLREMNHGKAFWRLVAATMPDYRDRDRWIDSHGPALIAGL